MVVIVFVDESIVKGLIQFTASQQLNVCNC